jgi:hypothetical protein
VSSDVEDAAQSEKGHGPLGWCLVAVVPVYRVAGAEDADVAAKDLWSVLLGELGGDEGIASGYEIALEAMMGLLAACSIRGTGHLREFVVFNSGPGSEELANVTP